MDILGLGLIYVNDWFLLVVIILTSLYYFLTWNFKVWESQGVSGPKPLPLVGTMFPFIKKGVYHDLDLYKKYGKVVGTFEGRTPALLVADPEFIKKVLVKEFHAMPSHRPQDTGSFMDLNLFNLTGDHWKLLRHTMSPTFSTGKIKAMMPQLNECSRLLVENLEQEVREGNDFNIRRYTGGYTMDAICRVAFGLEVDSQKEKENKFVVMMNKIFDNINETSNPVLLIFFLFPELVPLFAKLGVSFIPADTRDFFSSVVSQTLDMRGKETTKTKDFLNLISTAHKNAENKTDSVKSEDGSSMDYVKRPLTLDEIKAQGFLFFAAGYDTTANALCWLMYSLACNREIQQKVYDEIQEAIGENENVDYDKLNQLPYLDLCIQETLRMYPSAPRIDRVVSQNTTINGIRLPKGSFVVFSIFSMHRLPDYFPEPDKFKPERFSEKHMGYLDTYYYMPFGGGPRACIGMRLALVELKLAAVHLLQKFKFKTTAKTQIPPNLKTAINLKEADGTWLKAEIRA